MSGNIRYFVQIVPICTGYSLLEPRFLVVKRKNIRETEIEAIRLYSVCFESDGGKRSARGKPVEQRGEEHTNLNHMKQTPIVHSGKVKYLIHRITSLLTPWRYNR